MSVLVFLQRLRLKILSDFVSSILAAQCLLEFNFTLHNLCKIPRFSVKSGRSVFFTLCREVKSKSVVGKVLDLCAGLLTFTLEIVSSKEHSIYSNYISQLGVLF